MGWREGKWQNKRTKKIRKGRYCYNWAGDYFLVRIDGIHNEYQSPIKIYDEKPHCGNWKYLGMSYGEELNKDVKITISQYPI